MLFCGHRDGVPETPAKACMSLRYSASASESVQRKCERVCKPGRPLPNIACCKGGLVVAEHAQ